MPSRRLSKGLVPRRKQALDHEDVSLRSHLSSWRRPPCGVAAGVSRAIGRTLSSDFVDRAFQRSQDAIAHIFGTSKSDWTGWQYPTTIGGGRPWRPAAARPSWHPGGVLMKQ
jgi:hypothetical protein